MRSSLKYIPVTTAGALTPITQNAPATFFLLLIALPSWCADTIHNTGEPMAVPFHCTEQDIAQAGLTCSDQAPCPVYVELTSVAAIGSNKLFVTGNLHADTATLYSLLLESDDNGESWTEPMDRIRGVGFDIAQFVDFEHGWISGETIEPLARDPFFLITSDGAKTWRKHLVFDDGAAGSIQSFWFTDANNGAMVVDKGSGSDRYELYESLTGGDTWTVRESNDKPIRIRSMPPAGTGAWRLRADAKSHTFRIEKSSGESWKPIAGFLISAGVCKPE